MEMTKTDVKEMQSLYRKFFGMELDDQTARHKLTLLVRQMELFYQPITKAQVQALNEKYGEDEHGKLLSTK